MKTVIAIVFLLFVAVPAFGADSIVCADDDNNGAIDILKTSGLPDRDCDGELSVADGGYDCDDTDHWIRNGQYTYAAYETAKGICSSGYYRYCEQGAFKTGPGGSTANSGCTNAQLCERGTCYYVNPETGSDSNGCTWASPCATFSKLTDGGSITMGADTAIYLMGATDLTVAYSRVGGGGDGCDFGIYESEAAGTSEASPNIIARYPTSTASISPGGASYCDGSPDPAQDCCNKIKIQHNYWIVRGFEIESSYGNAVWVPGPGHGYVRAYNNYIHDLKGDSNNNIAGMVAGDYRDHIFFTHNIVNNVSDPTKTGAPGCGNATCDRQNVWNINFFGNSEDQHALYNSVGYSQAYESPWENLGGCIRWKHGNQYSDMANDITAIGNVVYRCERAGIRANSARTKFRGNLAVNIAGQCYDYTDSGGGDCVIRGDSICIHTDASAWINNTCVTVDNTSTQAAIGFMNRPAVEPSVAMQINNNVIYDNNGTCDGDNRAFTIFSYGDSTEYAWYITGNKVTMATNCWYNPNVNVATTTACYSLMALGAGAAYSHNSLVTFGWDTTGYVENPSLSAQQYRATSTNCSGRGWEAEWPEPAGGGVSPPKGRMKKRGRWK